MMRNLIRVRNKIYSFILYLYYFILEVLCKTILVQYSAHSTNLSLMNRNFGDDINKILINKLSNRKVVPYKFSIIGKLFDRNKYMCIGSVVTMFDLHNTIVWGTGVLSSKFTVTGLPKKVISVRGPLSRQFLLEKGIDCPSVYGDPALLLPLVYYPKIEKHYKIGIIPHYLDSKNSSVAQILNKCGKDAVLISVEKYGHWKNFINMILSCDLILSSSLHGIIISDAYNVPNIWCNFGFDMDDSGFKFRDYFLSVGKECSCPIKNIADQNIEDIMIMGQKWQAPYFDKEQYLKTCPFLA